RADLAPAARRDRSAPRLARGRVAGLARRQAPPVLGSRAGAQIERRAAGRAGGARERSVLRALRALVTGALAILALALAPAVSDANAACADCVSAGAARVELTVPAGTPLAGYGDR